MKPFYFIVAAALFVSSCNQQAGSNLVKSSLPGVYTFFGKDEISESSDTLTISAYNEAANTYRIIKTTAFNRYIDGKKMPGEFKRQEMNVVFNDKTMQLQDKKTGRLYSFAPGNHELLTGSAIYKKIK